MGGGGIEFNGLLVAGGGLDLVAGLMPEVATVNPALGPVGIDAGWRKRERRKAGRLRAVRRIVRRGHEKNGKGVSYSRATSFSLLGPEGSDGEGSGRGARRQPHPRRLLPIHAPPAGSVRTTITGSREK